MLVGFLAQGTGLFGSFRGIEGVFGGLTGLVAQEGWEEVLAGVVAAFLAHPG